MAAIDRVTIRDRFSIDGGDEIEHVIPDPGTWRLAGGSVMPYTTLAAHASNVQTLTLKKGAGGTALAMMTSDSDDTSYGAAFTKGTARNFVLTGTGTDLEFTGGVTCLELCVEEGGTCAALDVSVAVYFERVR